MALGERQLKVLDVLIEATRKMVEGELIQLTFNGNLDITEEQHLDISMRKTAFLFSACSQLEGFWVRRAKGKRSFCVCTV